jgi:AcrR family transcriptional regulator
MRREGTLQRGSADERKEAIIEAAIEEFAQHGLHGSSTERIAKRVGISQPYIFKLFGTKKELFLVSALRVCDRVQDTFQAALEENTGHPLEAMGMAYVGLLERRDELLVLLHSFAASADDEVRMKVRKRYAELYAFVKKVSDAPDAEVSAFFAQGMLMTIATAIDLPELIHMDKKPF